MGAVERKPLEEFRSRLDQWGELCAQLKELYYKYLDLAAFRSEKCYFPGRKCKRPWGREYDVGDLTLMWTYIANTAPLCGRLVRALAEVEYETHKRALESLEKYSGTKKEVNPNKENLNHVITSIRLSMPVYAYLVLYRNQLYVIWGELENLPQNGMQRHLEIDEVIYDIIKSRRHNKADAEIREYEVDEEYRRLWIEVPLPNSVSKLIGGVNKAPIALFRNLGWLLSDDGRRTFRHGTGNKGQIVARLFDWIALIRYIEAMGKADTDRFLTFKLSVYSVNITEDGYNSLIEANPLGATTVALRKTYSHFGLQIGNSKSVLLRGYAILRALKEAAFEKEKKLNSAYVINDVGAWIAFSTTVNTLAIGDGRIAPYMVTIGVKSAEEQALNGKFSLAEELAGAIGGVTHAGCVDLLQWHMRLMLPTAPIPVFEKFVKLMEVLANYPVAAVVRLRGYAYVLRHDGRGIFAIGVRRGAKLLEKLMRMRVKVSYRGREAFLFYTQLEKLRRRKISVELLTELEREFVKRERVLPQPSELNMESVKKVLEELLRNARVVLSESNGYEYVRIILYDETKHRDKARLLDAAIMLRSAGIKAVVNWYRKEIRVHERKSVEAIRKILNEIFSKAFYHPLTGNYVCITQAIRDPFTFLLSKRRRRRQKQKSVCPSRRRPSA